MATLRERITAPAHLEPPAPTAGLTFRPATPDDVEECSPWRSRRRRWTIRAAVPPQRTSSGRCPRRGSTSLWTPSWASMLRGMCRRTASSSTSRPGSPRPGRCSRVRSTLRSAGRGIGRRVLAWQVGRARQRLVQLDVDLPATLDVGGPEGSGTLRLAARFGFEPVRTWVDMELVFDDGPADAAPSAPLRGSSCARRPTTTSSRSVRPRTTPSATTGAHSRWWRPTGADSSPRPRADSTCPAWSWTGPEPCSRSRSSRSSGPASRPGAAASGTCTGSGRPSRAGSWSRAGRAGGCPRRDPVRRTLGRGAGRRRREPERSRPDLRAPRVRRGRRARHGVRVPLTRAGRRSGGGRHPRTGGTRSPVAPSFWDCGGPPARP